MYFGPALVNGYSLGKGDLNTSAIMSLEIYKVIVRGNLPGGGYKYKFTDDGHNFYLKTLALQRDAESK